MSLLIFIMKVYAHHNNICLKFKVFVCLKFICFAKFIVSLKITLQLIKFALQFLK